MRRWTRRKLMTTAGRAAGVAALARWPAAARGAQAIADPAPMAKLISLAGDVNRYDAVWEGRQYIREYVRDASHTAWVKLWIDWSYFQQSAGRPGSWQESWGQLNSAGLRDIDRQIRLVNDDGLGVVLGLYQAFPTWSWSGQLDPFGDPDSDKAPNQHVPEDVSTDSPWGWFVGHLYARYLAGAPPNDPGPHEPRRHDPNPDPWCGNPEGAHIDALEICNEPNGVLWPQEGIGAVTAAMLRSAEEIGYAYLRQRPAYGLPVILAPGTADLPDPESARSEQDRRAATDYLAFTESVLAALGAGWRPRVPVGWSHHNYRDVARLEDEPLPAGRARAVVAQLDRWRWPDDSLWITEGPYQLQGGPSRTAIEGCGTWTVHPDEPERQARLLRAGWDAFAALSAERQAAGRRGRILTFAQYQVNDSQSPCSAGANGDCLCINRFKSGLRGDYLSGPAPPRPAWDVWARLPGGPRA